MSQSFRLKESDNRKVVMPYILVIKQLGIIAFSLHDLLCAIRAWILYCKGCNLALEMRNNA